MKKELILYKVDKNGWVNPITIKEKETPDCWGKYNLPNRYLREYKKPKNKEPIYYTDRDGTMVTIFPEKALEEVKKIKKWYLTNFKDSINMLKIEIELKKRRF